MESPSDTIKRQAEIIEEQATQIERLEKERDAWKQKWLEAISSAQKAGLLTE